LDSGRWTERGDIPQRDRLPDRNNRTGMPGVTPASGRQDDLAFEGRSSPGVSRTLRRSAPAPRWRRRADEGDVVGAHGGVDGAGARDHLPRWAGSCMNSARSSQHADRQR